MIYALFSAKISKNGNLAGVKIWQISVTCSSLFFEVVNYNCRDCFRILLGNTLKAGSMPKLLISGKYHHNCFVYGTLIVSIFDVFFHSSFCCGHKWDLIRGGLREKLPPLEATAPASLSFVKHKLAAKSRQTSRNIIAKCWKCKQGINTFKSVFHKCVDVIEKNKRKKKTQHYL